MGRGEPNHHLDAALDRAGLSHAGLAKRLRDQDPNLRYDHTSVARWIRDGATPRHPTPDLICAIIGERLQTTITLADIGMGITGQHTAQTLTQAVNNAAATWRADHHRAPTTTRPAAGPAAVTPVWEWTSPPEDTDVTHHGRGRVDQAHIRRLTEARTRYQEMYRRVGGIPVRPRLAQVLHEQVAPLLRATYDDDLGRCLYRAAGGLAALAGVCAYDADEQGRAQAYLFGALRLAKASGDRSFGAYIVALLANQALYLNDSRLVVQYAEAALRAGTNPGPALEADLHSLAGKAYARMGDVNGAHQHLRQAEATVERLHLAAEPAEVSYVVPGLVETQVAEALRRLSDLRGAQEYAERAVETAPATHPRGRVHRNAGLALILAARGNADEAAAVGERMLDDAQGMESGRIRDRVDTVTAALRPHHHEPAVAAFLYRAGDDEGTSS